MTKEILFNVIHKAEAAGFLIVSMVSDLGSGNLKLWKSLNKNIDNISSPNPAASTCQICVFADAPHLLTLIKNHFLDHGFILHANSYQTVTSNSMQEIITRSDIHDLKTAHRCSRCTKDKRQTCCSTVFKINF